MENPKRVLQILGQLTSSRIVDEANHDKVLTLITCPNHQAGAPAELLELYESDRVKDHDAYWAPVIEAFMVAHYSSAHSILDSLASRSTAYNRSTASAIPVVVGLLKAINWADEAGVKNQPFSDLLPNRLASIIKAYACRVGSKEPDDYLFKQFSGAFANYLNPRSDEIKQRRLGDFASGIREIGGIGTERKIIDEVISRLVHATTPRIAIVTLANAIVDRLTT